MRYWMKKTTNATFGIDEGKLVQVALLQVHGGDGAYLSVLLGNLIGVSLVHFFCDMGHLRMVHMQCDENQ